MKTYTFPPSDQYGTVFAIVRTGSGTYVCPGWHPVPNGTTRDQIKFDETVTVSKKKPLPPAPKQTVSKQEWQVSGSKPGVKYTITEINGKWDCTCPAKNFFRGDCKHIKAKKNELITV